MLRATGSRGSRAAGQLTASSGDMVTWKGLAFGKANLHPSAATGILLWWAENERGAS